MTAYRKCDKCLEAKPLDGGCELGPSRWLCVVCWKLFRRRGAVA